MITLQSILFLNIRGLGFNEFLTLKKLLERNEYQLIIIQETSFTDHRLWGRDPFTFQTSIPYPRKGTHHSNGGLAIFCHPDNRHHFKLIFSDHDSILFTYKHVPIATSYYPPSYSNTKVQEFFIQQSNLYDTPLLYVGDFNYRIG